MKTAKKITCILLAVMMMFGLLFANGNVFGATAADARDLVNLDFEDGSLEGWKDNTATPISGAPNPSWVTRKVAGTNAEYNNVLGSNALEIVNISGFTYLQQYSLGAAVDNAVLEYQFSMFEMSGGHMALYLPVLLYEGAADNATDCDSAPLGLYFQGLNLYCNYGRGVDKSKAVIATLEYGKAYTIRVEYDLPTKSVKVFLNGTMLNLPTAGLEAGYYSDSIDDAAKLDRISVGAYSNMWTVAYIDNIKVTTTDEAAAVTPTEAPEVDEVETMVDLNFEKETSGEVPSNWAMNSTIVGTPPAAYFYDRVADFSGSKAYEWGNWRMGAYTRRYALDRGVTNAVLEYDVYLIQESQSVGASALLPTLLYTGANGDADERLCTPLQLYVQHSDHPILTFSFGKSAYDKVADLTYGTWYTIRVEMDLPTDTLKLYVEDEEVALVAANQYNVRATSKNATLDRISTGSTQIGISHFYLDNIKVTTTDVAGAPTDPAVILEAANALAKDESLPYQPTLTGTITSVDKAWNNTSVTVTMAVDGVGGKTISCTLTGEPADKLGVNDKITVTGTVKNENGTIGFVAGSTVSNWEAALRYGHSIDPDFDFGTSMVVCGDSITQGIYVENGVGYDITPYCTLLKEKIPTITAYKNKGVSGMYIYDTANNINSIYNQVMGLPATAQQLGISTIDTIFIAGGVNDFSRGRTLGSPTDTTATSFYGCLYQICQFLETNYPNSNVVFMTPLVDETSSTEKLYSSANAYRNAIHQVARSYGFNVVEGSLMGISGTKNDLVWDGIHPSQKGHELLANNLYELLHKDPNKFYVTVQGTGAGAAEGFTASGIKGESYALTLTPAAGYTYTVSATVGGQAATVTQNGNVYTVANISDDLVFTITSAVKADNVTVHPYIALLDNNMWLILQDEDLGDAKHATYNGEPMLYSEKYDAYAYLVVSKTLPLDEVKAKIGIAAGAATAIDYTHDVNKTGKIDANDAQYVYNMYKGEYTDITDSKHVNAFLLADANGDKIIDVKDAIMVCESEEIIEPSEPEEEPVYVPDYIPEGDVLLYHADLTSQNSDIVGTQTFDDFGLVVDGQKVLTKAYGISDRTVYYTCKFEANSGISFQTTVKNGSSYTLNTPVILLMSTKEIHTMAGKGTVSFLNTTDTFRIAISKNFQTLTVEVTNLNTNQYQKLEFHHNGTGGEGDGAIGQKVNTGMQYDYYTVDLHAPSYDGCSVSEIAVSCGGDYDLLIYGASINEPEAYWPSESFDQSWVQMLIKNFTGGKAMSSGRSGCTIDSVLERIKNELPYIKAKYCMITVGTNGGNTVENLTELVEYIRSQGATPILNHIPCYDNNGDTTGFIEVNRIIDVVRENEGVIGCDFDLATSVNGDGLELDYDTMWYEDLASGAYYYHHPNILGSARMFAQLQQDLPELFQ